MALGRFEVAARIATGAGSAVTVVTGRTTPLSPETGQAEAIRAHSAEVYGSDPETASPEPPSPARDQGDAPLGRAGRGA